MRQRDFLFKNFPDKKRQLVEMDNVSYYSVTDSESADLISKFLIESTDIDASKSVILDGMACIGGNTFSFAKYFEKVISNELNPTRYVMLKNNVRNLVESDNVTVTNESILTYALKPDIFYDVLFLDPEWGGPDYKTHKELELKIGAVDLNAFVNKVFDHKPCCKYILLKLPLNFALSKFVAAYKYIRLRKMLVLLVYKE